MLTFQPQFVPLLLVSFMITWLITPTWIRKALKAGLTGKDIQKFTHPDVAEMGGVVVLLSLVISVMLYISLRIFIFRADMYLSTILALLSALLIAGIIGIIDDILGWKIGLAQWQKPLLTLLAAAPLMAVNSGMRIMHIPFIGALDLGILYPLLIIPAFILVGANGFNMLAGYNGLEAGQGVIILSALAYFSYLNGAAWVSIIALCGVFALLGFLIHNSFPAKIFPGDTLTYTIGTLAAAIAIVGNIEKIFIILYIPYIIEFFLKLRGKFQKESFAVPQADGTLTPRYEKTYGLENGMVTLLNHVKIKTTERNVVYGIHLIELLCVLLAFVI